ncbi:hypothetical protein RU97_GL002625 [Enterococcus canis]|uniref:Uncharacterized protein n=2 Tax=Enterococcus canis TaxID=214095 RepID=A0A1L8RCK6_9ENTE|nr:hypothetical protein RU97_GL002625 [Enterococcus canis]
MGWSKQSKAKEDIMKKKWVLPIITMGLLALTACTKESPTASSSTSTTEASLVESSSTTVAVSSESSALATAESTDSQGNSSNFSLMVEAAQSQTASIKEQMGDMYSDISITEGKDMTIIYTYTLAEKSDFAVDVEAMRPTLVKGLKPTMDAITPLFPEAKIQVIFLNPDDSEIANLLITKEDTDKVE